MFLDMCKQDNKECPFKQGDFKTKNISRGTVEMVQVELPPYNPRISDILRVYVLYPKTSSHISDKLYFIIKRFETAEAVVLYAPAAGDPMEMSDLTGRLGDMEFEYKALEAGYARIGKDAGISRDKWSRDWGKFDWSGANRRIEKGQDLGLSQEECMELLMWISENNKKLYHALKVSLALQKCGVSKDIANFCAEHPEVLEDAISRYRQ